MKKIILLFFTFLGICCCFGQAPFADTDKITNILPLKTDSAKAKASANVFPNPAKNKVEIDVKGLEPGYVKLQLVSNSGKLVREEKRLMLTGNEIIVFMFAETAGLYFLIIKQGAKILRNKLVIR